MKFYKSFFLSKLFYYIGASLCLMFAFSYFLPVLFVFAKNILILLFILVFIDTVFLYSKKNGAVAKRICNERFSNGDDNTIKLEFFNNYFFPIKIATLEELPAKFIYNSKPLPNIKLQQNQSTSIQYLINPKQRGEYNFGSTLLFVTSPMQLVVRRYTEPTNRNVFVYPSFTQMQQNTLQGVSNNTLYGNKRERKLGNSLEFEQIKEYVQGDDFRTINWKATARRNQLMVNTFVDEKSQQVYCLIDKSRNMKFPFEEMTLLDYSINTSLVLSNTAINKRDKVGLVTFAEKVDTFLQADSKPLQMEAILQKLYNQSTHFKDADYEALYAQIRNKIKQRSLLVLFTNFESEYSLSRQMNYLKAIANFHLLVVIFFENTELKEQANKKAANTEEIYINTIADKMIYEKKLMVRELRRHGIISILTSPSNLTTNAINKYLEIKNRQAI